MKQKRNVLWHLSFICSYQLGLPKNVTLHGFQKALFSDAWFQADRLVESEQCEEVTMNTFGGTGASVSDFMKTVSANSCKLIRPH